MVKARLVLLLLTSISCEMLLGDWEERCGKMWTVLQKNVDKVSIQGLHRFKYYRHCVIEFHEFKIIIVRRKIDHFSLVFFYIFFFFGKMLCDSAYA